jgi:uncharacterized cupin superfamily protein
MNGPIVNLDQLEIRQVGKTAAGKPEGYDIRRGEIGSRIGARKLGYNLTVVAPGKRNCPFHNHRVGEEMFFILEGSGELRYGDARHSLRAGDIIACPPGGPETAHQIINTGDVELRYLAVGSNDAPDICELPGLRQVPGFRRQPERRRRPTAPIPGTRTRSGIARLLGWRIGAGIGCQAQSANFNGFASTRTVPGTLHVRTRTDSQPRRDRLPRDPHLPSPGHPHHRGVFGSGQGRAARAAGR